jgi:hypothetical protein
VDSAMLVILMLPKSDQLIYAALRSDGQSISVRSR